MFENFYRELGKHIKKLRVEKGLTQNDLSELADIHPKFVGKIERAVGKPSLDTMLKLSNALNIKIQQLFDFDY